MQRIFYILYQPWRQSELYLVVQAVVYAYPSFSALPQGLRLEARQFSRLRFALSPCQTLLPFRS